MSIRINQWVRSVSLIQSFRNVNSGVNSRTDDGSELYTTAVCFTIVLVGKLMEGDDAAIRLGVSRRAEMAVSGHVGPRWQTHSGRSHLVARKCATVLVGPISVGHMNPPCHMTRIAAVGNGDLLNMKGSTLMGVFLINIRIKILKSMFSPIAQAG